MFGKLIDQQQASGFIEVVPQAEIKNPSHYIPYHYVTKDSATTPIRIVYNCSCKAYNGVSFNDCVEPALQNDELQIILRFRIFKIGIVADVEKAFHHIGLNEKDQDYLRWLWLKNPKDSELEFKVLRFKVIPFGAKSSPFILNSTVIKHLNMVKTPIAEDMQRSIFVDNIITGCESREEALKHYEQANEIMGLANQILFWNNE